MKAAALFILAAAVLHGADAPRYTGARACGACHTTQYGTQSRTGHARALSAASGHPLAESFASGVLARGPDYRFQFRWEQKELRVRAADRADVIDIPVEWAFGAGAQAVTFVTRVSADWYLEHYFSYYPAARGLAPTPGQQAAPAGTLQLAMGVLYKSTDPVTGVIGCFECHSTGPVLQGSELRPSEAGVRCEACHGPGGDHKAIRNPGKMPATELNQFCGKCHRQPAAAGEAIKWSEAWNVRHQPLYLDQSACFRKSGGRLSCLTCHEPHSPLVRDDAFYNGKCEGCHDTRPQACSADCVSCHMPRVSPQAYLRFTNHWIGIYGEGDKLKPKRQ